MDFDYMASAAYGEYVTIDEMLSKVKIGSGCELQESDPLDVINRQDAYGLTMLMEGRARGGVSCVAVRNNHFEVSVGVVYVTNRW